MPARLPRLRTCLVGLGLAAATWFGLSLGVAWHLTRRPVPVRPAMPSAMTGLALEDVRLDTADGQQLGAWFGAGELGRAGVVLLHGKHGSRADCLAQAAMLQARGSAVLLVTLRGHGDSTGEVLDFGPGARADVIAAVEWLQARRPGQPVVVWGSSLGAAAAAFAVTQLGTAVHGWQFECLYLDLPSAVLHRTARRLPPGLDQLAAWGLLAAGPLLGFRAGDHDVAAALAALPAGVPVVVMTGADDDLAPPAEGAALARAARTELVVVSGAGHEKLAASDPDAYRMRLEDLVTRAEAWARTVTH